MTQAEYLTAEQAAEYVQSQGLPCSTSSLAKWRRVGGGPRCLRFGPRAITYEKADLDIWVAARLREVAP
jgi:hypothetical protein